VPWHLFGRNLAGAIVQSRRVIEAYGGLLPVGDDSCASRRDRRDCRRSLRWPGPGKAFRFLAPAFSGAGPG
jgi:hypothetical protein